MAVYGFTSSYVDLTAGRTKQDEEEAPLYSATFGTDLKPENEAPEDLYTMALGAPLKPQHHTTRPITAPEEDLDVEDSDDGVPYVYASYSDPTRCLLASRNAATARQEVVSTKPAENDDEEAIEDSYQQITGPGAPEDVTFETCSAYADPAGYSVVSKKKRPASVMGYSSPVLPSDAGQTYVEAQGASAQSGVDGDYFPVLHESLPSPKGAAAAKFARPNPDDGAALAEELSVRQKVAALLASLSTDSRQRVLAQLKVVEDDGGFEVIQQPKVAVDIKKEKEQAKRDQGRQWNEEFQQLMGKGLLHLTPDDIRQISRLSHDFVKHAEIYAKVIINELNVPDDRKTIKPASVGGVAGGAKYIVQGILFKFCLDPLVAKKPAVWLYGGDRPGDDHAMKAAGLELQGLGIIITSRMPELHLPLMALVDYKGFRMVATCLLPIGPDTLRYGSNDAGRTIKAAENDSKLAGLMDDLGQRLNLRKHLVGKQRVAVVGPGDVEGHLGTDGRYYLLDFARLMPPETPLPDENGEIDGRGVFFRMLRPELVRSFRVPLSSDTFTGWGMYDENHVAYELDVREATDLMINTHIPALAAEIDKLYYEGLCDGQKITPAKLQHIVEYINLVPRMHGRGINLRHLGRLRQKLESPSSRRLIFSMALARAFKAKLRKRMRNSVQNQTHTGASSESACKDVVLEFFNTVLGHTERSDRFWTVGIKRLLRRKFPFLLSEEEARPDYNLRNSSCIRLTFMLSFQLGLVRLPDVVTEAIFEDFTAVRLVETDILDIPATIKHNQLSHVFDGEICMLEASKSEHKAMDALRLLHQARQHLMAALDMSPSCAYVHWVLGTIEAKIASRHTYGPEAERSFTNAYARFARSFELDKGMVGPLNSWADALEQHAACVEADDAPRAAEMVALALAKRQQASATSHPTLSCSLITSRG